MPEQSYRSTMPNLVAPTAGLRPSASAQRRPGTADAGMVRPISAPNLLGQPSGAGGPRSKTPAIPGVRGAPSQSRGFATTILSPSNSMSGSIMGSPPKLEKSFTNDLIGRLDARDLAALAMVELLDPPESAAIDPPPVSAPLQARRKGTDYWLAGDFEQAAAHFLRMAQLYSEGSAARSQALRMRAAALMRLKRFDDALAEGQKALSCLGQPDADPSTDRAFFELVAHRGASADALAAWQLLGVVQEALGRHQEATLSLSRALLLACVSASEEAAGAPSSSSASSLPSSAAAARAGGTGAGGADRRHFGSGSPGLAASSLLTHFLSAAARAQTSLLPLQVYVTMPRSESAAAVNGLRSRPGTPAANSRPGTPAAGGSGGAAAAGSAAPAFRLVLRPRFTPWPMDLQVGDLPGVEIEGGTRLSFYCAYREMPGEPHACLVSHHRAKSALVLLSVRIDGVLEVLSNSTEAAWAQVGAFVGLPPQQRSLHDFDVVSAGWTASGVGVASFAALVGQKWAEWEVGRGRAAAKRQEEERELARRQEVLREWLQNLGLEELHERLIREGVDLERLQFVTEADLQSMGVSQLAMRRQLMAAVQTQQQYKALMERIADLEADHAELQAAHASQRQAYGKASRELHEAREQNAKLESELENERAECEELTKSGLELVQELEALKKREAEANARADAFAHDVDILLHEVNGAHSQQQHSLKDFKATIDRRAMQIVKQAKRGGGFKRAGSAGSKSAADLHAQASMGHLGGGAPAAAAATNQGAAPAPNGGSTVQPAVA